MSFISGIIAPLSSATTLEEANKATRSASLAYDGSKSVPATTPQINNPSAASQILSGKLIEIKREVKKEEEKKEPGFFEKAGKDIKDNWAPYLVSAGAGAFAGWLLFGGLLGPIGMALAVPAFIVFSRITSK